MCVRVANSILCPNWLGSKGKGPGAEPESDAKPNAEQVMRYSNPSKNIFESWDPEDTGLAMNVA